MHFPFVKNKSQQQQQHSERRDVNPILNQTDNCIITQPSAYKTKKNPIKKTKNQKTRAKSNKKKTKKTKSHTTEKQKTHNKKT